MEKFILRLFLFLFVSNSVLSQTITVVDKEKEIYSEQAKNSGKPDNIIDKMIEGRMVKFYKENVLMEQQFVVSLSLSG